MKINTYDIKRFLLLFGIVFSISIFICNAREKVNISIGFGLTEFLNTGIRFQLNQVQLGLTAGTLFSGETSFSGEVYYHFAGKSNLSERKPWYVKSGFTLWHFKKDYMLFKALSFGLFSNEEPVNVTFLNASLGRDFNLTENFGINSNVGLAIPFNDKDMQISPAVSISLFYRL
jgi:hypothetical protein